MNKSTKNYDTLKLIFQQVEILGKQESKDNLFLCKKNDGLSVVIRIDKNTEQTHETYEIEYSNQIVTMESDIVLFLKNTFKVINRITCEIEYEYTSENIEPNLTNRSRNSTTSLLVIRTKAAIYDRYALVINNKTGKLIDVIKNYVNHETAFKSYVEFAVQYYSELDNKLKLEINRYANGKRVTMQEVLDLYGLTIPENALIDNGIVVVKTPDNYYGTVKVSTLEISKIVKRHCNKV